jgi:hypothetical protein
MSGQSRCKRSLWTRSFSLRSDRRLYPSQDQRHERTIVTEARQKIAVIIYLANCSRTSYRGSYYGFREFNPRIREYSAETWNSVFSVCGGGDGFELAKQLFYSQSSVSYTSIRKEFKLSSRQARLEPYDEKVVLNYNRVFSYDRALSRIYDKIGLVQPDDLAP